MLNNENRQLTSENQLLEEKNDALAQENSKMKNENNDLIEVNKTLELEVKKLIDTYEYPFHLASDSTYDIKIADLEKETTASLYYEKNTYFTGHSDGSVYLRNSDDNKIISSLDSKYPHTDKINKMMILREKSYLITASDDATLIIWQLSTLEYICTLKGHTDSIYYLTQLNSNNFASSTNDSIIVWDISTKKLVYQIKPHVNEFFSMLSFKENKLISVGERYIIWQFDIQSNELKILYQSDLLSPVTSGLAISLINDNSIAVVLNYDRNSLIVIDTSNYAIKQAKKFDQSYVLKVIVPISDNVFAVLSNKHLFFFLIVDSKNLVTLYDYITSYEHNDISKINESKLVISTIDKKSIIVQIN